MPEALKRKFGTYAAEGVRFLKISACVIAKNEAANIERCLQSLKEYVDEMVVVDTGSTDATIEIARSLGAKIYAHAWQEDFSAARNFAKRQATGEWIFFPDADEFFAPEGIKNAIAFIKQCRKQPVDGIVCRIVNIDTDHGSREVYSFLSSLRIFRNVPELWFRHPVHEELYRESGEVRLLAPPQEIRLFHTGYSSHLVEEKCRRNLRLLLADIAVHGEQPHHYPYLLDCYCGLGQHEEVIRYARLRIQSAVAAKERGETRLDAMAKTRMKLLDALIKTKQDYAKIEAVFQEAAREHPSQPIYYVQYARYLLQDGDYESALRLLQDAVVVNERKDPLEMDFFHSEAAWVHLAMGEIHWYKRQPVPAIESFLRSLLLRPYDPWAFRRLYSLLLLADVPLVISLFAEVYDMEKQNDMEFIVWQLQNYPLSKVYSYYQQKLKKNFQRTLPLNEAYGLMSAKNYHALWRQSFTAGDEAMLRWTITLLLNRDWQGARAALAALTPAFRGIVLAFYQGTAVKEKDAPLYLTVLKELLLFNAEDMGAYLKGAAMLSTQAIARIGRLLLQWRRYDAAWSVLSAHAADREIQLMIGECRYRIGDFAGAERALTRAEAAQALPPYFRAVLRWSRAAVKM